MNAGAVHHHYASPRPTLWVRDGSGETDVLHDIEASVHPALERGWPPLKQKISLQSIHIFFTKEIAVKLVARSVSGTKRARIT